MRAHRLLAKHLVLFFLVLISSICMCVYWRRINTPQNPSSPPSVLKPRALTDFYPRWYATREFLLHHRDPYGAGVNRDLQIAYYGKELDPSRPEDRVDQQRFVYPAYFMFFVAPTAWTDFDTVRIVVWWVLLACAVLNLLLWLRFLTLRLTPLAVVAMFVLVLTSIPVLQNLSLLQPFLLTACLLAATAVAVVSGHLFLGGALLALATVKPQICFFPLAWFALWLFSDWIRRRSLLCGFTITLATLLFTSEWILPGWLVRYPLLLRDYAQYTKTSSLLGTLLPSPLSWIVAVLAFAAAGDFCWRVRRQPADSVAFAIALSFGLARSAGSVPAGAAPCGRRWVLPGVPLAGSMALPFAAFGILLLLRKAVASPAIALASANHVFQSRGPNAKT